MWILIPMRAYIRNLQATMAWLHAAVERVDHSGGTSLTAGIRKAIEQFTAASYDRSDAYKYVIFLTDGDGSYSESYTAQAKENGIVIYTIGLGTGVKESVLLQDCGRYGRKILFCIFRARFVGYL